MSEPAGLRRVLELVAPAMRSSVESGAFVPSNFATPLALAALALDAPTTIAVTATSNDAEHVTDALRAWLGEDVALWPGWDTHPLEWRYWTPTRKVICARAPR